MRESFRGLLLSRGFQIRLAPKGTLPFDTDATIRRRDSHRRADPRAARSVAEVSPVLGGQLHVPVAARRTVSVDRARRRPDGAGRLRARRRARSRRAQRDRRERPTPARARARVGDTRRVATGYDPQLRALSGAARAAHHRTRALHLLAAEQRAAALPLATLQAMSGAATRDRASLFMVRVRDGADVERVRALSSSAQIPHGDGRSRRRGDRAGRRAPQLLPSARGHPRRGQPRRRISARDDARHRVGERAPRRDRRDARDRCRARTSCSRSCSKATAISSSARRSVSGSGS